jgi:hypothetical protein
VSAPVFDYTGKIVAALTLVGLDGVLNMDPQGQPIRSLLKAAANLSSHVGGNAIRAVETEKPLAKPTTAGRSA